MAAERTRIELPFVSPDIAGKHAHKLSQIVQMWMADMLLQNFAGSLEVAPGFDAATGRLQVSFNTPWLRHSRGVLSSTCICFRNAFTAVTGEYLVNPKDDYGPDVPHFEVSPATATSIESVIAVLEKRFAFWKEQVESTLESQPSAA